MRIIFLVQGEGRGHLTQAIALKQLLESAPHGMVPGMAPSTRHEVVEVLVGKSPGRKIPSFFSEQIGVPVREFDAPNIIYNAGGRGINLKKTIFTHLTHSYKYVKSLRYVRQVIEAQQPDLIVNFYELFGGLLNVLGNRIPVVSVAHQYLLLHPDFTFPPGSSLDQALINFNSRVTSWRSSRRLALSFRQFNHNPDAEVVVVPPLLREEIQYLRPKAGSFLLVYMTHFSLGDSIKEWHMRHPEVELECFWDNPNAQEVVKIDDTLTFHQINSEKYLRLLSQCRALATTAGFESVCEALYLGKPVMMVPVPKHFEQTCNALDGVISGAGISSKTFNLSVLLEYLPTHIDQSAKFRNWYHTGRRRILQEIEALASTTLSEKPSASTYRQNRAPESFL